jgi:hypothetical protein
MIKVIQLDEAGSETAMIEIDEFTSETVYQGIAVMLREATPGKTEASPRTEPSKAERQRRQRILTRLRV